MMAIMGALEMAGAGDTGWNEHTSTGSAQRPAFLDQRGFYVKQTPIIARGAYIFVN
jgi:hypothetical protein